jgi:biotin carboxyl carrier protein
MPYEVKIKERKARVEILEQNGTWYKVKIGDRIYDLDVARVENGVYSVIYNGKSTNMEMIEGDAPNKYIVNTRSSDYEIEILDAKARYAAAHKGELDNADTIISSPMPGKVVRIPVKKGTKVAKGDTVIVVSAMKMESEYKSPVDGVVKKVFVKEDATINGHQPLIEIEKEGEL